ncbi:transglycosylase domain-containing protein [Enterococcus sp. AZ126]|uniref:transglycosylase domain-containing protein n=1 Tax=Enterococcus sp. AZ126 TaxID=2774635 RepID=UPI003F6859CD
MYHYIEVKLLDNQNNSHKTEQHSKKVPEKKKIFLIINVVIRVLQSLFVLAVVLLLLGGALGLGVGMGYFAFLVEDTQPPTKEELQTEISDISEVSRMTYADGTNIAMIKSDLVRTRVDAEHISPLLKKAIISTEDEYFEEHKGVVPKAVIRALVSDATGIGGSSGGSTLTQQLVKQQILTDETTFKRKANEILLAYRIEKYFSKDEIVTTYLNVSPFGRNNKGENIAGVEEAAKGLFGKNTNDLTLPQAAFIAGLPQSPIVYTPYSNTGALKEDENLAYGMKRKDFVLFSMYREKAITKEEYEAAKNYDLKQDFQPQQESNQNTESYLYNAVLEQATNTVMDINIEKAGVKKETLDELGLSQYKDQARKEIQNRGYTIQSTIDQVVYDSMQNAVANFGYMLDDGYGAGLVETGNVLMDNKTGKIIGFVAGRDFNVSQSNHALDTVRQVGSTIKPISVYGPAIDQGMIGSESRLANYPTTYRSSGKELANATNSGTNTFDTVRHSLEWSYNIPVYHLNEAMKAQMGDDNFSYNNYLSKMNYPASDAWAYESAPLGSVETTVLTQTNGFQTLANKGQYQKGYMIDKITDNSGNVIYEHKDEPVQVYYEATASIMNDMMRSVLDSKITTPFKNMVNGLNPAFGNVDWIGKTGTTDAYKDAWLVVSTPTITLGSWTGYDNPTAMSPNSGDQNSAYLANLANAIYSVRPDLFGAGEKFTLSKDVIKSNVSSFTGEKPGTFTYDGGTYTAPGPNIESFYAKDGAPKSQYKFGYGGSDANYNAYWGRYAKPSPPSSTTPSSSEKKEEKKKEEEKKENTTPTSSKTNNE